MYFPTLSFGHPPFIWGNAICISLLGKVGLDEWGEQAVKVVNNRDTNLWKEPLLENLDQLDLQIRPGGTMANVSWVPRQS